MTDSKSRVNRRYVHAAFSLYIQEMSELHFRTWSCIIKAENVETRNNRILGGKLCLE